MTFDPGKHHRRSIRLKNYDYSQPGFYFVTLCTYKRQCWFGQIQNHQMHLNQIGKIVADEWLQIPNIRPNFQLDEWIIMPNHLHGILIIQDINYRQITGNKMVSGAGNTPLRQKPNSLSSCIAGLKSAVTK